MKESETKEVVVEDIEPAVVAEMLHFIYTGGTNEDTLKDIGVELLVAADKYELLSLKEICEDNLCSGLTTSNAVQYLILGAKAKAVMEGRSFATLEDVKAISKPVLRHRIITTFNAESNNITSDDVVTQLLEKLPERREQDDVAPELAPAFNAA